MAGSICTGKKNILNHNNPQLVFVSFFKLKVNMSDLVFVILNKYVLSVFLYQLNLLLACSLFAFKKYIGNIIKLYNKMIESMNH